MVERVILRNTYWRNSKGIKVKGKKIPLQTWTGLEDSRKVEAPQISRQSVHEGGKVVSPTRRPAFTPPVNIPGTHSC
jgi:hypothetical protein